MSLKQHLPTTGPEREILRERGQFWTPDWIAEAMVGYVLADGADILFDPAVGAGAFFQAAKNLTHQRGITPKFVGREVDTGALQAAKHNGLSDEDLADVTIVDFVLHPPQDRFKAIVANPPYIRHHRLSMKVKEQLREMTLEQIGEPLDGRAGLHIYFLIQALHLLAERGRLAFIMPADTCEGVFAPVLWKWITDHYCLEAVIAFASEVSPFPGVDTNPLIFLVRNIPPQKRFHWAKCIVGGAHTLKNWMLSDFKATDTEELLVYEREVSEGLATGLSRPPSEKQHSGSVLGDFARVLRGIATGANEFFFLTKTQADWLDIPNEFLLPAVGRTRDVPTDSITAKVLDDLERKGRPTRLLSLDGRPIDYFPETIRDYLQRGETIGLPQRPLIATRRPWYKMEVRTAPPFLFAYLGRRNSRFIRNLAGVVPLTGFLCIYPRSEEPEFIENLWEILSHPTSVTNLALVGKSYGGKAIKVEPRALEQLPLPVDVRPSVHIELPRLL